MISWIMLEYERDRELVVCRNMQRLAIIYYHPVELRIVKSARNAPQAKSVLKDYPLLPGTIFLRGGFETARRALSTQYTEHVVADAFEVPLAIPENQMLRFQATVLEYNDQVRKKWEKGQQVKADERKKFVTMSLEVLAEYKERAFGKSEAA